MGYDLGSCRGGKQENSPSPKTEKLNVALEVPGTERMTEMG